mmetsp:Transcript_28617/g.39515  ORF Transcript_28617/g.39515 Transcript_28617/m.39515 type:complete len:388 (-) Transcript_28617:226-1389(-)
MIPTGLPPPPHVICSCCTQFCTKEIKVGEEFLSLSWKVDNHGQGSATFHLAAKTNSWIGLGFGTQMVNSIAVIARNDVSNVLTYKLEGRSLDSIVSMKDPKYNTMQYFQIRDPSTNAWQTDLVFNRSLQGIGYIVDIIVAYGPNGNLWKIHKGQAVFKVKLLEGVANTVDFGGDLQESSVKAHAILMTFSWGFIMPLGILASIYRARFAKRTRWFYLHRFSQTLGVILSTIGFTMIVIAKKNGRETHWDDNHSIIGLAVMIIAGVVAIFAVSRPAAEPEGLCRAVWKFLHTKFGYGVQILAFANIFIGLKQEYMQEYFQDFTENIQSATYVQIIVISAIFLFLKCLELKAIADSENPVSIPTMINSGDDDYFSVSSNEHSGETFSHY